MKNLAGYPIDHRPSYMKKTRPTLKALALAALLASQTTAALAADAPEPALRQEDLQAVFQLLINRECQRNIKQLVDKVRNELSQTMVDENTENRICSCTANVVSNGQRMKAVYQLPPERLKTINADPEFAAYLKGKSMASVLLCTGYYFDSLLDPKPKQ